MHESLGTHVHMYLHFLAKRPIPLNYKYFSVQLLTFLLYEKWTVDILHVYNYQNYQLSNLLRLTATSTVNCMVTQINVHVPVQRTVHL